MINSEISHVFLRRYASCYPEKLDVAAMKQAAGYLCGTHDFAAFTSAKRSKKSTVRTIEEIRIEKEEDILTFTFCGNGFLFHMVRILMGTLLEVGAGKRSAEKILEILKSKDRSKAGVLAPAKGLTLLEVKY